MPSAVGTISQLRVGDVVCATVKDEYFSTLRRAHDIPNDFLDGQFDFGKLAGGGGKGGDLMSRTLDGAMFVKRLNLDDARSLLHAEFLEAYVERLLTGSSLLCKILVVFDHPTIGRFLVMANCLPTHIDTWSGLYDLKGSSDDKVLVEDGERVPEVHKRCWNVNWMICEATGCNKGIPQGRMRYRLGKRRAFQLPIYLTKDQKEEIMTAVHEDVKLFKRFHLMDYSMIIGIYRPPPGKAVEEANRFRDGPYGKAYAAQHGGDVLIVYFGIIDFLQGWTSGKQCAHLIKWCFAPPPISTISPPRYALQFEQFFEWKCVNVPMIGFTTASLRGVAHPIPSRYVDIDREPGELCRSNTMQLAAEVKELKAKVGWLQEKISAQSA